jgi:hypothetical protein
MKKLFLLIILTLCLLISPFGQQADHQKKDPIILGILEDHNTSGSDDPGKEAFHTIRVLFKKTGVKWYSLKDAFHNSSNNNYSPLQFMPEIINWHVCFDGKEVGMVKSKRYKGLSIPSVPGVSFFMPDTEKNVPIVGPRSNYFRGWADGPIHRPLVVNTMPYYQDLEVWKPYVITEEDLVLIKTKLQKQFRLSNRALAKAKITSLRCYQSQINHAKILSIEVGNVDSVKTLPLDAATEDEHLSYYLTFFVDDEGIRYLQGSLTLVDVGDYDSDGINEFIFKYQGYNYDGYIIYYNNFKQFVEFGWNYH